MRRGQCRSWSCPAEKGPHYVFEAIGRRAGPRGCLNWDGSRVILADEALQAVALGKTLYVTRSDRPADGNVTL